MAENIDQRVKSFKGAQQTDLTKVLDTVITDLAALRAAIVGITAKLDADVGVTDTNYAATQDPAALETQS